MHSSEPIKRRASKIFCGREVKHNPKIVITCLPRTIEIGQTPRQYEYARFAAGEQM